MMYLGDFVSQATIDFMWSSNNASGASITRATNGTISVYKGNSTTQSTTGVTDTEDFDSLTGIHHCRIATTDAFYATGNNYTVVLSGATIDGQTVNAVLATFSIENRYNPTPPTAAAIADAVWDEATSGHTTAGTTGEALTDANNGTPPTSGAIADAVWDEALAGHATAGSAGKKLTDITSTDPWLTALPGAYGAGTAGKILGDKAFNASQIGGSATAATAAGKAYQGIVTGTAVTGTLTSTAFTTNLTEATNDHYNGRTLTFITGPLAGQQTTIADYNGATKLVTVAAMTEAPANGNEFFIA